MKDQKKRRETLSMHASYEDAAKAKKQNVKRNHGAVGELQIRLRDGGKFVLVRRVSVRAEEAP